MLRKMFAVSMLLAAMLVLFAGTALAQGDGNADKGKTLWEANLCKSCHGANGEGKYAGPLAGTTRTAEEVIKQARTPRANMPAFDAVHVSDMDLTDMWAYLRTLSKPASFTPTTYTAAASDMPGKVLFNQKRCVACHGSDPSGFVKARFTNNGRTVSAAAVIKQLRTPFQKMPMFNTTKVSDEQAGQIADYLKSLAAAAPAAGAAAPKTLPTAGGQLPWAVFPGLVILIGVLVIGAGMALRASTRA